MILIPTFDVFGSESVALGTDHQPEELLWGDPETVGYNDGTTRTHNQTADGNPYRRTKIGRGLKLIGLICDCRPTKGELVATQKNTV